MFRYRRLSNSPQGGDMNFGQTVGGNAQIGATAAENWTATANGCYVTISATAAGGIARTAAVQINVPTADSQTSLLGILTNRAGVNTLQPVTMGAINSGGTGFLFYASGGFDARQC